MAYRRTTRALLLGCAILLLDAGLLRADPRAVIELFTSQGCSSCPAADKLIGELASDRSLVTLSLPIDYWDYLGWKDTLADPRHTARQHAYARERGDGRVYTPQVVINGSVHALGSDQAAIERAIAQTARNPATLSVPVTASLSDGKIQVAIAAGAAHSAEVWLCAVAKDIPIAIGRGENRGRTVTYHNVARRWVKLGEWKGAAQTFSVPLGDLKNAADLDSAAIIVQSGSAEQPGAIIGATTVALH
jgi:hypothetical protein